jgi:monoamine oxidase
MVIFKITMISARLNLFAGEHCGGEFSGYMNGAAKSEREAAEEILKRLD